MHEAVRGILRTMTRGCQGAICASGAAAATPDGMAVDQDQDMLRATNTAMLAVTLLFNPRAEFPSELAPDSDLFWAALTMRWESSDSPPWLCPVSELKNVLLWPLLSP